MDRDLEQQAADPRVIHTAADNFWLTLLHSVVVLIALRAPITLLLMLSRLSLRVHSGCVGDLING